MGRSRGTTLLVASLFLGACAPHPQRHPVTMVPVPPPEHQKATLAVGGGAIFDAEDIQSVKADNPDIVHAYGTKDSLILAGKHPGKVTLTLLLRGGDMFYFDVEVTNDPPAQHALLAGEDFTITYDGVQDYALHGQGLTAHKTLDGTQLLVKSYVPGLAIVGLTMVDGSIHRVELIVLGGDRLL